MIRRILSDETRMGLSDISSQTGLNESRLQTGFTICAGAGILSLPFTGPIGLGYVLGVLGGKFVRRWIRGDSKESYEAQRLLEDCEAKEEYLDMIEKNGESISERMKSMSSSELERISGFSLLARRTVFGGRKMEVRAEYE
jgi:hypothetical protein